MPRHVVVDGSNIATEGRAMPSLKQLNEAVMAFMAENPDALVTVVVDASFGHRIDSKEVPEFDLAVSNNEIVAPPAGAIGRGDAFVLSIAHKVNATILSNDSYQEFHGTYPWLFDEGRLVGGKPVPHIGWVFVNRLPVRGPTSRKAVNDAKRRGTRHAKAASPEASQPMPVPAMPPPGATLKATRRHETKAPAKADGKADHKPDDKGGRKAEHKIDASPDVKGAAKAEHKGGGANDLLAFLDFVEHHHPGSSVNAIVESYSSHGAYVRLGEVRGYVPLSLMADPPPRSAREFMKIGESVTLVVESFTPGRRSIDLAMPTMATIKAPPPEPAAEPKPKRTRKAAAAPSPVEEAQPATPPRRTRATKKAAAPAIEAPAASSVPEAAAPVTAPTPSKRARKAKSAPAPTEAASPSAPAPRARSRAAKKVAEPAPAPEPPAATPPSRRRTTKAAR